MATDVRSLGASPAGLVSCAAAVNAGIAGGGEFIFQNGTFLLDESIKIPSNTTIYIKNAILKMADASYDNLFRNSDFTGGNVNVKIIGLGNACLDGNSANNYDENTLYGVGSDNTYHYLSIAFGNVNGFEISGLNFVDIARWNIVLQSCTNGIVGDLYFNYFTLTANQDGIDLLQGCNNISISNIKGYTADDLFAVAVGEKPDFYVPIPNWSVGDIHDITINDIYLYHTAYHVFITLGGDGNKIYDIDCNDWKVGSCFFLTYFGLAGYYNVAPSKTDVQNITFDNIEVLTQGDAGAVIRALEPCQNIAYTNFTNSTGKADYSEGAGVDVENFTINGAQQSV